MYRLAVWLLSILLALLLLLSAAALLLFTDSGNAVLKPYVQKQLREATGLPLALKQFKLRWRTLQAGMVMPGAQLRVAAVYDPFKLSYSGSYRLKAKAFVYQKYRVSQADVKGRFRGSRDTIAILGKGTLLNAPVAYNANVKEGRLQSLKALTKNTPLSGLLEATGMPPLARGGADLKVDMPNIDKKGATGYAHLEVHDAHLERTFIQKQFGYTLPKNDRLTLLADAKLHSDHLDFGAKVHSALLNARVMNGRYEIASQKMEAAYRLDVKELGVLTQKRLHGSLAAAGELRLNKGVFGITGTTKTFGGETGFVFERGLVLKLEEVSLPRVLRIVRAPQLLSGTLEGEVKLSRIDMPAGDFSLHLKKGVLKRKRIETLYGITLPDYGILRVDTSGKIDKETLIAEVKLHSKKADLQLPALRYGLKSGTLKSDYRAVLHTPEGVVKSEGEVRYTKALSLKGTVTGLGKKATYRYDGTGVYVEAPAAALEKLAALAGLPVYLRGNADISAKIDDLKRLEGSYAINGKKLRLNPKTMKQLTGKVLDWPLSLEAKGKMRNGHLYGGATVVMRQGILKITALDFNSKRAAFFAKYRLELPELSRLSPLTGRALHGKMLLAGTLRRHNGLHFDGTTTSLGGKIAYRLDDDLLRTTFASVPLHKLVAMMDYPDYFMGTLSGTSRYSLKRKRGSAKMRIADFRIKPSPLTQTLAKILPKDPTRIIYKTTTLDATFAPNRVNYTLHARGSRSTLDITEGWVDTRSGKQHAQLKFVYEKYTIYGIITGTTEKPKFTLDTSKFIEQKVSEEIRKKVEKKWGKEVGVLLKGLGL